MRKSLMLTVVLSSLIVAAWYYFLINLIKGVL